jgi:hypothetical protein
MWSAKDFLEIVAVIEDDVATFNMPMSFDEIASSTGGIESLNDQVDYFVEDGMLLTDLSYKPVGLADDTILVEVTANAEQFLEKYK